MAAANSYFVPGYGISRAVIQNEIHYYCGPQSIVRPYVHQVGLVDIPCMIATVAARLTRSSGTRWLPSHYIWTTVDPGSAVVPAHVVYPLIYIGPNRRFEDLVARVRRKTIPDIGRIERFREPTHCGTSTPPTNMTNLDCMPISHYHVPQVALEFFWSRRDHSAL